LCAKEKFVLNTQLSLTQKTHNISYSLLAFDPSYIASNTLTYNMTYHMMFWHVGVENIITDTNTPCSHMIIKT